MVKKLSYKEKVKLRLAYWQSVKDESVNKSEVRQANRYIFSLYDDQEFFNNV